MKAYTKPKKVEWFEYTGDVPKLEEWCESVGLFIKHNREGFLIRFKEDKVAHDFSCDYAPMQIYNHTPDCVVVRHEKSLHRMPKDHFLKHYDVVPSLLTKEFLADFFKEWDDMKKELDLYYKAKQEDINNFIMKRERMLNPIHLPFDESTCMDILGEEQFEKLLLERKQFWADYRESTKDMNVTEALRNKYNKELPE